MTRSFPPGDQRVSDAERDAALAELSEHFQAGRLTHEEFDERSSQALSARTGDDLRALFSDLPVPGTSAADLAASGSGDEAAQPERGSSPVRGGHWPTGRIVVACVIAAIVLGNVTVSLGHGVHQASFGWLVPVIILLVVFRRMRG